MARGAFSDLFKITVSRTNLTENLSKRRKRQRQSRNASTRAAEPRTRTTRGSKQGGAASAADTLEIWRACDVNTELPEFVLIVEDSKFHETSDALAESRALSHISSVYPTSITLDANHSPLDGPIELAEKHTAFHETFDGHEPEGGWVAGNPYKVLHATGRYVDARQYADAYNVARVNETLTVLTDLGAKTILISQAFRGAREGGNSANASLSVPTAEAVPASVSAEFNVENSSSSDNETSMTLARERPAYKPHLKPAKPDDPRFQWFYRRGPGLCEAVIIKEMIEKRRDPDGDTLTIKFSHTFKDAHLEAASVELGEIIGLGYSTSASSEFATSTTIDVTFFTKADFTAVQEYQTPLARMANGARRSLASLAAHRHTFLKRSDLYRSDVMFDLGQGLEVPVECVTMEQAVESIGIDPQHNGSGGVGDDSAAAAAADTLAQAALIQAQVERPGRALTVPFTLYGPKGAGKSSVLFTFDEAMNGNAEAFVTHGEGNWRDYRSPARKMSTFLKDVHFDANLSDGEQNVVHVDKGIYAGLSEKNVARLVFHDTEPAVSAYKDIRKRPLPFGMRILVLKLEEIQEAVSAGQGSDAYLAMRIKVMSMLGPPSSGSDAPEGTLHRYPPFAVILASHVPLDVAINGKRLVKPVEDLNEVHEKLVKWFMRHFHVTYLFPMQTLAPMSTALASAVDKDKKLRNEFLAAWEKVAEKALDVLNDIFIAVAHHEQLSASSLLAALKSAEREAARKSARGQSTFARLVRWFQLNFVTQ